MSVTTRVNYPLVAAIKVELASLVRAPAPTSTPKVATYSKTASTQHPSVLVLQGILPIYARTLTLYFPATRAFTRSHLASLEVSVI